MWVFYSAIHGIFITRTMSKCITVIFSKKYGSLIPNIFYNRCVIWRDIVVENFCTASRTDARGTNSIFDRKWNTRKSVLFTTRNEFVSLLCFRAGKISRDSDIGIDLWISFFNL